MPSEEDAHEDGPDNERLPSADSVDNELDEHPDDDDLPRAGDTVDHKGGVAAETEILVDCWACWVSRAHLARSKIIQTEVVVDVDTSPLTHCLNETTAESSVSAGFVADEVPVAGGEILPFCIDQLGDPHFEGYKRTPSDLSKHLVELLSD